MTMNLQDFILQYLGIGGAQAQPFGGEPMDEPPLKFQDRIQPQFPLGPRIEGPMPPPEQPPMPFSPGSGGDIDDRFPGAMPYAPEEAAPPAPAMPQPMPPMPEPDVPPVNLPRGMPREPMGPASMPASMPGGSAAFAQMFNGEGGGGSGPAPGSPMDVRRFLATLGGALKTASGNTPGGAFMRAFGGGTTSGTQFDNRAFDERHKLLDSSIRLKGQDEVMDYRNRSLDSLDAHRRETNQLYRDGVRGPRGLGGAGSVNERIKNLMAEDSSLSYRDALALAQRAPDGDRNRLSTERLALTAAKADRGWRRDPDGTLERYRRQYNLPPAPRDVTPYAHQGPMPEQAGRAHVPPADNPDAMSPGDGGRPVDVQHPPMPPALPPGSQWSPSREQWRTPDGRLYDADGQRVE